MLCNRHVCGYWAGPSCTCPCMIRVDVLEQAPGHVRAAPVSLMFFCPCVPMQIDRIVCERRPALYGFVGRLLALGGPCTSAEQLLPLFIYFFHRRIVCYSQDMPKRRPSTVSLYLFMKEKMKTDETSEPKFTEITAHKPKQSASFHHFV